MTQLARCAPYETYLHVHDCKSGEDYFMELKDDDLLDLQIQLIRWVREEFYNELEIIMSGMEGDYFACIKTDFNSPDSVISWESGGFYLK
jgi:hypothetical protein